MIFLYEILYQLYLWTGLRHTQEMGIITRSLWYPGEIVYSTGYDPGVVFKVKVLDRGTEQTQRIQMPPK